MSKHTDSANPETARTKWLNYLQDTNTVLEFHPQFYGYQEIRKTLVIPSRIIDDYFCSFIIKGNGRIKIEDQSFYLEPGVFFLIPPGIRHDYILQDNPARFTFRFKLKSEIRDIGFGAKYFVEDKAWGLQTAVMSLSQELQRKLPYSTHKKKHLLSLMCVHIFRNEQKFPGDPTMFTEFQCCRISDFFAANVNNRPTPSDLAATLDLTPDYFSRIFKHTYKISPREWLVRERIRLASLELTAPASSISQVAYHMGYPDVYLFSRQFKKVIGISPRDFRKQLEVAG